MPNAKPAMINAGTMEPPGVAGINLPEVRPNQSTPATSSDSEAVAVTTLRSLAIS